MLPTYSTYCVFRSTYVATMSFESNLGFFFQRTYIKGIEEIKKKTQNTFSSASQFPPLDCGFYIIKQVIVANPACCFWKMDDWRKFPNDVRKSACVTQLAQTKYFTGHSFLLHHYLVWQDFYSLDCLQIHLHNREHLPNWNICLLICGACLWLKVWMKMKNSSHLCHQHP